MRRRLRLSAEARFLISSLSAPINSEHSRSNDATVGLNHPLCSVLDRLQLAQRRDFHNNKRRVETAEFLDLCYCFRQERAMLSFQFNQVTLVGRTRHFALRRSNYTKIRGVSFRKKS